MSGLVINGFQLNGIKIDANGDNVIAGNFIGTNVRRHRSRQQQTVSWWLAVTAGAQ